jgi:hypothetical protein
MDHFPRTENANKTGDNDASNVPPKSSSSSAMTHRRTPSQDGHKFDAHMVAVEAKEEAKESAAFDVNQPAVEQEEKEPVNKLSVPGQEPTTPCFAQQISKQHYSPLPITPNFDTEFEFELASYHEGTV